jgi:hypothetical protein
MSPSLQAPIPAGLDRVQRPALLIGGALLLVSLLGALLNPAQFFRSYLFAFIFWEGLSVGCLSILMLNHLTGGMWGLVSRRFLEAGTRMIGAVALFFVPLALGLRFVYVWVDPQKVAGDHALFEAILYKRPYLNVPFFLARAVFYFAVWMGLARMLSRWSLRLDAGQDLRLARRMRTVAAFGLVFMGLTITFSSIDWVMSVDPRWFSSIFGILFMVGQALSAFAAVILVLAVFGDEPPFSWAASAETLHDLGKLLFAFVMLWAYMSFSQFLLIWSGNLPEEIPWYLRRLQGGWQYVGLFLVLFHFAVPFLLLLSRGLKRNPRPMRWVAAGLLLARMVDVFWLVSPEYRPGHLSVHWLDLTLPVALGGLWVGLFVRQLRGRPLLPVGEPEIRELAAEATT